jgi:hypothetical protein
MADGVAEVVKHLPSKHKALSSNSSTNKKNKIQLLGKNLTKEVSNVYSGK